MGRMRGIVSLGYSCASIAGRPEQSANCRSGAMPEFSTRSGAHRDGAREWSTSELSSAAKSFSGYPRHRHEGLPGGTASRVQKLPGAVCRSRLRVSRSAGWSRERSEVERLGLPALAGRWAVADHSDVGKTEISGKASDASPRGDGSVCVR